MAKAGGERSARDDARVCTDYVRKWYGLPPRSSFSCLFCRPFAIIDRIGSCSFLIDTIFIYLIFLIGLLSSLRVPVLSWSTDYTEHVRRRLRVCVSRAWLEHWPLNILSTACYQDNGSHVEALSLTLGTLHGDQDFGEGLDNSAIRPITMGSWY